MLHKCQTFLRYYQVEEVGLNGFLARRRVMLSRLAFEASLSGELSLLQALTSGRASPLGSPREGCSDGSISDGSI